MREHKWRRYGREFRAYLLMEDGARALTVQPELPRVDQGTIDGIVIEELLNLAGEGAELRAENAALRAELAHEREMLVALIRGT